MNNPQTALSFDQIIKRTRTVVNTKKQPRNAILQQLCDLLASEVAEFDWVGFYLVNPEAEQELVLGPFNGEPTEHTHIPFGKGICGQSAATNDTFVVQDVDQADNYLSCSTEVKAEIVVPVMKDGTFVAELDIDSHTKNSITPKHRELLEKICDIIVTLF